MKAYFELALLFLLPPLLLTLDGVPRLLWLGALWAAAILCLAAMRRQGVDLWREWGWQAVGREVLVPVLRRFAICAAVILAAVAVWLPERLFAFPLQRPGFWLVVMVLYPLLSALPQEIVFRSFLHRRYAPLFGDGVMMIAASALVFGFAHVMMKNPVAVLMSAVGGLLFSHTYIRHRSLALAWIEHSLYGCFIFTVGLGIYFYRAG